MLDEKHVPVLLKEVIEALSPDKGIIIDGTIGMGGHAMAVLENSKVSLIGLDQDEDALEIAKENLRSFKKRVKLIKKNFGELKEVADSLKITGKVTGILLDIGVSSYQLDNQERGFSFQNEGPLDMRMDKKSNLTAEEIVNTYSEKDLADIIYNLGEERLSYRIAKAIIDGRKIKRIKKTSELADLIKKNVPKKYAFGKIHPATRTFQALRIEVNQELENLKKALESSVEILGKNGRIVVISFHSLEDRIVKRFFKDMKEKSEFNILTKKPVVSSREEQKENPRSRSAKLRAAEKI